MSDDAAMPRQLKLTDVPGLADYLAAHARQDEVLARVEREAHARPDGTMQIEPAQGALLTLLTRLVAARQALELGTFTGYSAICIARGLTEGGTLTCLELDPDRAAIAQRNLEAAGVADRVTIEIGPADRALERMPAEPRFDLAFIDADKSGYPAYYELVLPRVRQGGLILLDNALLRGRVVDPADETAAALAELNRRIADDERVDAALVAVADGMMLARKR